jgi:hypothetical protein
VRAGRILEKDCWIRDLNFHGFDAGARSVTNGVEIQKASTWPDSPFGQGSQYTSERYIRVLEKHGVQISMSRVGMATDNAKIESFFGGFKRECVNLLEFDSLADVLVNIPAFWKGFTTRNGCIRASGICRP